SRRLLWRVNHSAERETCPPWALNSFGDSRLNRGDASPALDFHPLLAQPHFESANSDQHVKRAQVSHVPDAHELALHLVLSALHRYSEFVAHELDDLAGIDSV